MEVIGIAIIDKDNKLTQKMKLSFLPFFMSKDPIIELINTHLKIIHDKVKLAELQSFRVSDDGVLSELTATVQKLINFSYFILTRGTEVNNKTMVGSEIYFRKAFEYIRKNYTEINADFDLDIINDLSKFDKITILNKQLTDIKVIMVKNIEQILDRGEKLDVLIEKSKELSDKAKLFYKETKKVNKCCVIM